MPRKRSSGDGALYFVKQQGLWRGVVDLGFGPDGRRKQKAVTSKSQAEARRKLNELKAEIAAHGAPLDKQTKLSEWAEHWLETDCRPRLSPNGLSSYETMTRRWIVPTLGARIVGTLKPSDVRLMVRGVTDAGRSSSTANKAFNILSAMLEAARLEGLIARNVAKDVTPPKNAVSTVTALSTSDALAVLATSQGDVDGSRWWAGILDGLRQGERLGAQIDDLDLDAGTYTVRWAQTEIASEHGCGGTCGKAKAAACPSARLKIPDGYVYRRLAGRLCLVPPKSGKTRTVPIPPPLVVMLREYLAATAHVPNPHGLIWRNQDGSPIISKQDEQDWRDLLHRAGLITADQTLEPRHRPAGTPGTPGSHTMRHTTATVLMELGVDVRIVMEIVGHQSERVTRGTYQHVSSAAATEAMAKLADHFTERLALI